MSAKTKRAIQKSVNKATVRNSKPSKEKHIRAIILHTFSKDNAIEEIIRALTKRLEKSNWTIVLKSLMIFHRCFKDGDGLFIESMKTRSLNIFSLRHFHVSAPVNHLYTVFVKKYAKYLEEKVSVLRLLGFQFEKNKDSVKELKPPKCFKIVPKLQSQLNALLNCKIRSTQIGNNLLIHKAYLLLIKDSLPLYSMLNEAVLQLLDMFWRMEKKDANRVLSIYKLFCKETDALIGLYEIGKRFLRQLPEINKAETSIIESMEKYVESLPDSDSDSDRKKKKKKQESSSEEGAELNQNHDEEYDGRDYHHNDEDDEDESGDGESESSDDEDDQGADDNYFADFYKGLGQGGVLNPVQPNPFQNPNAYGAGFAPSFGPGAGNQSMHHEATYAQKANLIKSLANVEYGGGNTIPFNPVNPFATAPAGTQNSNPFANVSNPFGGGGGHINAHANSQPNFGNNVPNPFSGVSNNYALQQNQNIFGSGGGHNPSAHHGSGGGHNPNIFGSGGGVPQNIFGSGGGHNPGYGGNANVGVGGHLGNNPNAGVHGGYGVNTGMNPGGHGVGAGMNTGAHQGNVFANNNNLFGNTNTPQHQPQNPFGASTNTGNNNPFLNL